MSNILVCSVFRSFFFLSLPIQHLIYTLFRPYLPPSLCSVVSWVIKLLFVRRAVWTKGASFYMGDSPVVNRWRLPITKPIEWQLCSGSAHFSGWGLTWAPAVGIFYFLLRGSRLHKLIKSPRQRDGQEEYQLWGETDLHLNPFSAPTSSGILASFSPCF